MVVAQVLVASQAQKLDRLFDYLVPHQLETVIQKGSRVLVPFQNRLNLAYVWDLTDHSDFSQLKEIHQLVDVEPLLNSYYFDLINWLADHYYCSRVEAIKLCLPPGGNLVKKNIYQLAINPDELAEILKLHFPEAAMQLMKLIQKGLNAEWGVAEWEKKFNKYPQIWEFLLSQKTFKKTTIISDPKIKRKTSYFLAWSGRSDYNCNPAAIRVRNVLQEKQTLTRNELCAAAEVSPSVVNRLLKEGVLTQEQVVLERKPVELANYCPNSRQVQLNEEQQQLYQRFLTDKARVHLLHGVTGSGKTEIYFQAAADYLNQGQQVLYLVPEISLTPQTLTRARERFGEEVALLHSNMANGERFDQWFKIKNREANLVIGPRSAIFAPFSKLGLIIVDEEHETTYKQEETPRYHTRTVVQKLAEITGAKVILGSATPSLESFHLATTGIFSLLNLDKRFNNNALPEITIVDMRQELQHGNKNILSKVLYDAIEQNLSLGQQTILLLNRRGYSTFILCRDCGHTMNCPSCDVSLTYHLNEKTLRCHYCDHREPIPNICPKCGSIKIRYFGSGTQKLEEEIAKQFQTARILRMDLDSTSRKGAHYQIYQELSKGTVDILLGTQMIAKGLDLPKVTLVGVISADSTLNIPDFRAAERTFQLLTQVAGRAGRGETPGKVIFQAYNPEHYSLQLAKTHDYRQFFAAEIARRSELNYPPFTELIKVSFTGLNYNQVRSAALKYGIILSDLQKETAAEDLIDVLGPAPALIPKIQDKYRWQLILKSNQTDKIDSLLRKSWETFPFKNYADVKIIRDRDPYSVV